MFLGYSTVKGDGCVVSDHLKICIAFGFGQTMVMTGVL